MTMDGSPTGRHRNLLLEAPPSEALEFDQCVDLLTPVDPPETNVWSLGITLPPDERLRLWEARRDAYPADFRIVSGQPMPQARTVERARELGYDPTPRFASLEDPKNLTRLGIELVESLSEWEDDDRETALCFHSLTALLQHVSVERAYQFLLPFTAKVREFGATAHYHLNPRAHDDQDIERLETLFDAVQGPGGR